MKKIQWLLPVTPFSALATFSSIVFLFKMPVTHLLTELFPNNAYVGRLGGDEFAVCAVYDAFDKESMFEYIKKKAEKICEVNRRTYTNGTVCSKSRFFK